MDEYSNSKQTRVAKPFYCLPRRDLIYKVLYKSPFFFFFCNPANKQTRTLLSIFPLKYCKDLTDMRSEAFLDWNL
jgi:hypothetical protein